MSWTVGFVVPPDGSSFIDRRRVGGATRRSRCPFEGSSDRISRSDLSEKPVRAGASCNYGRIGGMQERPSIALYPEPVRSVPLKARTTRNTSSFCPQYEELFKRVRQLEKDWAGHSLAMTVDSAGVSLYHLARPEGRAR